MLFLCLHSEVTFDINSEVWLTLTLFWCTLGAEALLVWRGINHGEEVMIVVFSIDSEHGTWSQFIMATNKSIKPIFLGFSLYLHFIFYIYGDHEATFGGYSEAITVSKTPPGDIFDYV